MINYLICSHNLNYNTTFKYIKLLINEKKMKFYKIRNITLSIIYYIS